MLNTEIKNSEHLRLRLFSREKKPRNSKVFAIAKFLASMRNRRINHFWTLSSQASGSLMSLLTSPPIPTVLKAASKFEQVQRRDLAKAFCKRQALYKSQKRVYKRARGA